MCRLLQKSSKNCAIANLTLTRTSISVDFAHNTMLTKFSPKIPLIKVLMEPYKNRVIARITLESCTNQGLPVYILFQQGCQNIILIIELIINCDCSGNLYQKCCCSLNRLVFWGSKNTKKTKITSNQHAWEFSFKYMYNSYILFGLHHSFVRPFRNLKCISVSYSNYDCKT